MTTASAILRRRLVNGATWSLLGEAGSRAFTFLAALVLARLLGVASFGAFTLIQGTLAMFLTFATLGMGQTTSRHVAIYRVSDPARIPNVTSMSLLLSGGAGLLCATAMVAAAPAIAEKILGAPQLVMPLSLAAPVLALSAVTSALYGTIRGFEAFERLAKIAWGASVVSFVGTTGGALLAGLTGALIGLLVGEIFSTLVAARLAQHLMKEQGMSLLSGAQFKERAVLWRFSLPALLGGALHVPVFWVCQMLISTQLNGVSELGLYGAAQRWMTLVTFVPSAAAGVMGPILSSLSGTGDVATHRQTTIRVAVLQTALCAIPAAALAWLATNAMSLFGPEFIAGANVVVWMMLLAPIIVSIRLFWDALLSLGWAWSSLTIWLLWTTVALILTYAWRDSGAAGLAQAMLAAYTTTLIVYLLLLRQAWDLSG
jgi:O-antigen/teichoic acid export membrane protein